MLSLLGILACIEVADRIVIKFLTADHVAQNYFVEDAIKVEDRGPICRGETVEGYVWERGVYYGRYQFSYSYRYYARGENLKVYITGTTPRRQWPLWIFSVGLEDFRAWAHRLDVSDTQSFQINRLCKNRAWS
jgi:hypothetical protein